MERASGYGWDLRLGDWRTVLADVDACDAVICDPPFSARVHGAQRHGRKDARYGVVNASRLSARGFEYAAWSVDDARAFVAHWTRRCSGWICVFTSHDLVDVLNTTFESAAWTTYAPLSCVQRNRNVRLAGDGPANWTDHLVVARPRSLSKWGALPGAYTGEPIDAGENALDRSKRAVPGGKPLWLMRAIIRDYTRAGALIVDPFAGGATTALAAVSEGRTAITSEIDPKTYAKALARLRKGITVDAVAALEARAQLQAEARTMKSAKTGELFAGAK